MSFETEARVADLMRKIERKVEMATQNPEAVVYGQFEGTSSSGVATAWVDAVGRVERVSLAAGSAQEGAEQFLADQFMEAISRAKAAAENLGEEETAQNESRAHPTPAPTPENWQNEEPWDEGGSFLR
ncbi:hypothetical protein SAMN05421805_106282 [Saccharopolyspora antimicrobica]|uniref:YbaB/EbfC DNA-binding family protein n=1 Tax=Saccharopolyspora antimicrobica TaxID=455193 RepID=A0A1I5BJB2_9PSEU|nr:YbaB/EbfC family nucleoid-associated protein [Saccharopolyspora antimicrobica]RKT86629.1 hypothetical protein ATL45_5007 [Saccharopolyspora antimicrobica]SFN74835.1 hypothetical protein SAMN05421805_106282 [Saccharopolyspora antimicrobica]